MTAHPGSVPLAGHLADKFVELGPGESIPVREFRRGDRWVIEADLPGFDPSRDIEVVVRENTLLIDAHRHMTSHPVARPAHGKHHQVVSIPAGVTPHDIDSLYAGGVLTLTMPLRPARRTPGHGPALPVP